MPNTCVAAGWPRSWLDTYAVAAEMSPDREPPARVVRRAAERLFRAGLIANAAGAAVVFQLIGSLIPIFIDPDERWQLGFVNFPILVVIFGVGGFLTYRVSRAYMVDALAWVVERREPTAEEHRKALRLPLRQTKIAALSWIVSIPIFVVVNLFLTPPGFVVVIGVTIALGALTTSAVIYLLAERILRPVTAMALAARLPAGRVAPGVRERLAIAWAVGTGIPLLGILVIGMVGLTRSNVDTAYLAAAAMFLGGVALGVGLIVTLFVARAIADPVTSVRAGLERVESGDLEAFVRVDDGSEVGLLQAGFNRMAEGLREREQLRDLFGRQVGKEVARAAVEQGTRLGGEEREVAALFIDFVGSTTMALRMPPEEVVALLNRFFAIVVDVIEVEGGFVNKFEGDAALCVFGAPLDRADPAGEALCAARRLAARLSDEVPEVGFGIGVSAGRAVAGNIGAEERFEYTVIGDPVNEASRLCELAKQQPQRVLASEAALKLAAGAERASWTVGEPVTLRGRDEPTPLASPATL
jgi:adenylate cyclase